MIIGKEYLKQIEEEPKKESSVILVEAAVNPIKLNEGFFNKYKNSAILKKFSKKEVKNFVEKLVKGNVDINNPSNKEDKDIINFINKNICDINKLKKIMDNSKSKSKNKLKNNKKAYNKIQSQQANLITEWLFQQQQMDWVNYQNLINLQNMINQQQIDLINQMQQQQIQQQLQQQQIMMTPGMGFM